MRNSLLTETEADYSEVHTENDEEEAAMLKRMAQLIEEDGTIKKAHVDTVRRVQICSCGNYTCGLITTYGTAVPTFKEKVEPLWPQARRDRVAREIRRSERK